MKSTRSKIYNLNEEVTKTVVRDIIKDELEKFLKDREFENKVINISTKNLDDFISQLYNKKSMWINSLKK